MLTPLRRTAGRRFRQLTNDFSAMTYRGPGCGLCNQTATECTTEHQEIIMQPILRAAGSLLLGIALAGPLGSTSAPAQAAVPPANIRSSSTGISFFGSNERDQVVFSRAGTPTAP